MGVITSILSLLEYLASNTADESKAEWPKGPTATYRTEHDITVAQYVQWIKKVEASPALAGQSAKQIVQRMRRLYFSKFTEAHKPGVGETSDKNISSITPKEAPLTTDHVDLATLNGLYSTSTIRTSSGIPVDVGHLWMPMDLALAGKPADTAFAEVVYLDSDLEALLSWAGDLGAVANKWAQDVLKLAESERTDAKRKEMMIQLVNDHSPRDDLFGDIDGVILARRLDSLDNFVLSDEIAKYYQDDSMPQNQAKALAYPNSARRIHYFLRDSDPGLPATGKGTTPLDVSITASDLTDLAEKLESVISDAADDLIGTWYSFPDAKEKAGPAQFKKLCANFAAFLKAGLSDPNAPWPPNTW